MDQIGMVTDRPLPALVPFTKEFWTAAKSRKVVVQRCKSCGTYRFPPQLGCYACGSSQSEWAPVSGRATLYSWTVSYPPLLPFFHERAPWPVAVIQLEEGPRMVTNLVDVPIEEYKIGMALRADFEDVDDETTLVVFRRATE